jgi:hypothetical protein
MSWHNDSHLATPDAKSVVKAAQVRKMNGHSRKVQNMQFNYCVKIDTGIADNTYFTT